MIKAEIYQDTALLLDHQGRVWQVRIGHDGQPEMQEQVNWLLSPGNDQGIDAAAIGEIRAEVMMSNPHEVTKQFEEAIADYCGSSYAVAVTSCTAALLLCCVYQNVSEVEIPCRTYVGVGQSILNAGGRVKFRDVPWSGMYQLRPYPIYDAARRTTSGMYLRGTMMCLSLHVSKICGVDQGDHTPRQSSR